MRVLQSIKKKQTLNSYLRKINEHRWSTYLLVIYLSAYLFWYRIIKLKDRVPTLQSPLFCRESDVGFSRVRRSARRVARFVPRLLLPSEACSCFKICRTFTSIFIIIIISTILKKHMYLVIPVTDATAAVYLQQIHTSLN